MEVLHIKNMVCDRCISTIKAVLDQLEVEYNDVQLGEVQLAQELNAQQMVDVATVVSGHGFEVIDRKSPVIVSKIKSSIIDIFKGNEVPEDFKLSQYLRNKFPYDYAHMSRVFSQHQGDTIEHYLIKLRI